MMFDFLYYWKKIVSQIRNIGEGPETEPSLVPNPNNPPELCEGQLLVVGRSC